jgi:hypothetical protein
VYIVITSARELRILQAVCRAALCAGGEPATADRDLRLLSPAALRKPRQIRWPAIPAGSSAGFARFGFVIVPPLLPIAVLAEPPVGDGEKNWVRDQNLLWRGETTTSPAAPQAQRASARLLPIGSRVL